MQTWRMVLLVLTITDPTVPASAGLCSSHYELHGFSCHTMWDGGTTGTASDNEITVTPVLADQTAAPANASFMIMPGRFRHCGHRSPSGVGGRPECHHHSGGSCGCGDEEDVHRDSNARR